MKNYHPCKKGPGRTHFRWMKNSEGKIEKVLIQSPAGTKLFLAMLNGRIGKCHV